MGDDYPHKGSMAILVYRNIIGKIAGIDQTWFEKTYRSLSNSFIVFELKAVEGIPTWINEPIYEKYLQE